MTCKTEKVFVAILAVVILASNAKACLWPPDEHPNISEPVDLSEADPQDYVGMLLGGRHGKEYWQGVLDSVSEERRRTRDISLDNRIAVALIHLGRVKEAIPLLENLERKEPGSYYVAANLGTAFELVGDVENAIKWIGEGINRNPESHFGTEWVHLKILKAKQAIQLDPTWAERNSVLGIDWVSVDGNLDAVRVSDDNGMARTAADIQKAIEYQLRERTEFVKPPDPTVASLFYDLSQLVRLSKSEQHASIVLGAAIMYGYAVTDADVPTTEWSKYSTSGLIALIIILTTLVGFGVVRRVRQTK